MTTTETEETPPLSPATTSTSTKLETFHFINSPASSINEALTGLTHLHPNLSYNAEYKILYRSDLASSSSSSSKKNNVTTIGFSGGGHEPMFGGFVGQNFLSAYVSGEIFASPTARQILEAIRLCQPHPHHLVEGESNDEEGGGGGGGTLIVCGNYTGDILNAGLAVTRARAEGYRVHFTPVGDDVAVGRRKGGLVGRRGLSGHLVALKCACALAEREGESTATTATLERVAEVMEYVAGNVGTIGVAFDRYVVMWERRKTVQLREVFFVVCKIFVVGRLLMKFCAAELLCQMLH